jgi:hypothetical protein
LFHPTNTLSPKVVSLYEVSFSAAVQQKWSPKVRHPDFPTEMYESFPMLHFPLKMMVPLFSKVMPLLGNKDT